jgi:hypothetical protein
MQDYIHSWTHRGAKYMTENKALFFTAAAVKGTIFAGLIALYSEYQKVYGDPSQGAKESSFGVDLVEDIALSAVLTLGMYTAAVQYMKHDEWHPESAKASDKTPVEVEDHEVKVQLDASEHAKPAVLSKAPTVRSGRAQRQGIELLSSKAQNSPKSPTHAYMSIGR